MLVRTFLLSQTTTNQPSQFVAQNNGKLIACMTIILHAIISLQKRVRVGKAGGMQYKTKRSTIHILIINNCQVQ